MDVLSSSFSDNKIAWYENDGTGNFGSQIVISTAASGAILYMPPIWMGMGIWMS
jgi:hypothetical protein